MVWRTSACHHPSHASCLCLLSSHSISSQSSLFLPNKLGEEPPISGQAVDCHTSLYPWLLIGRVTWNALWIRCIWNVLQTTLCQVPKSTLGPGLEVPDHLWSISCKACGCPLGLTFPPDSYLKKAEFITIIVILETSPFDKVCRNKAKVPRGICYIY